MFAANSAVQAQISDDPDSKIHGANMGPIWADRTQVDPMLAPWTLLSGELSHGQAKFRKILSQNDQNNLEG